MPTRKAMAMFFTMSICVSLSGLVSAAESFSSRRVLLGLNFINYGGGSNDLSIYGPNAQDLEEARQLGAHVVRIWVYWRKIEAQKGTFIWEPLDEIVRLSLEKGLEPWALVTGSPPHSSLDRRLPDRPDELTPPQLDPYKVFLRKLVNRYRGKIHYYEIWCEPDLKFYWTTGPNAREYAELLKVSYPIIKEIDPTAQVLMAATGTGTNLGFIDDVLRNLKGAVAFDAAASHLYPVDDSTGFCTVGPQETHSVGLPGGGEAVTVNSKEDLLLHRQLFTKHGYGPVDLWITEFGWPAYGETSGPAYVTFAQQADYLRQLYELLRDDPDMGFVKGLFWFCDRDWATDPEDKSAKSEFGFFGLMSADHTWKPAAKVFRELATSGRKPRLPSGN